MSVNIGETYIVSIGNSDSQRGQARAMKEPDPKSSLGRLFIAYRKKRADDPTQEKIAKLCGKKQGSISEWGDPSKAPSIKTCRILKERLGVCVEWIITGDGPMYPTDVIAPTDQQLTELLRDWTSFSPQGRAALAASAKFLATQPGMREGRERPLSEPRRVVAKRRVA